MPRIKVCGLPVLVWGETVYSAGPGSPESGRAGKVSRATALRLSAVAGHPRPPGPGSEMRVCGQTWLVNAGGRFEIARREPGAFAGIDVWEPRRPRGRSPDEIARELQRKFEERGEAWFEPKPAVTKKERRQGTADQNARELARALAPKRRK